MAVESTPDHAGDPDNDAADLADLRARVEVLEEENRRLRQAYSRIRRTRHRRTAIGLVALGLVGLGSAILFPAGRVVLVVLGATGVFGGLLTWYLTPERFVAADIGERVYAALAGNMASITAELGLAEHGRYVPLADAPDREAVLYLPQAGPRQPGAPAAQTLSTTFVVPEDPDRRGLALRPTGEPLVAALREASSGGLPDEPAVLVDLLCDGLREQFELVDAARPDVDVLDGRASVAVAGSAYGAVDRFDHPIASLLATGLAVGLETAVEVAVDRTAHDRGEYLVTVRWEPSDDGAAPHRASTGGGTSEAPP